MMHNADSYQHAAFPTNKAAPYSSLKHRGEAMFKRMKVATRIYLINGIAAIGMMVIVWMGSHYVQVNIEKERNNQTQIVVEAAYNLVQKYKQRAQEGEFSVEDAKKRAISAINILRYNGDNYIWVNDYDGIMIGHPMVKLIGTSMLDVVDAKGAKPFADMINIAKNAGEGSYQYYWPPGEDAKLKLSYAKGDRDWKWVVASGTFVDDTKQAIWQVEKEMGGVALLIVILIMGIAMLIGRSISNPLKILAGTMAQLATGDLEAHVTGKDRGDEAGMIARSVEDLKGYLLEKNRRQLEEQQATMQGVEAQRRRIVVDMTDKFDKTVSLFLGVLSTSMEEMKDTAGDLKDLADQGQKKSSALKIATTAATENVTNVASASEEMLASIKEIANQIALSSSKSQKAVDQTKMAGNSISELKVLSDKIGEISKLIQNIASQTNLLALNATIEAARAGDAGKGFAVVASEVKALASQTGKATEEIEAQISAIQSATDNAVTTISTVSNIVMQVNEVSASVAAAMEEQSSAISDIVRNTQSAADRTKEAGEIAVLVSESSVQTQTSSASIDDAAGSLSKKTEDLRGAVEVFLAHLKTTQ